MADTSKSDELLAQVRQARAAVEKLPETPDGKALLLTMTQSEQQLEHAQAMVAALHDDADFMGALKLVKENRFQSPEGTTAIAAALRKFSAGNGFDPEKMADRLIAAQEAVLAASRARDTAVSAANYQKAQAVMTAAAATTKIAVLTDDLIATLQALPQTQAVAATSKAMIDVMKAARESHAADVAAIKAAAQVLADGDAFLEEAAKPESVLDPERDKKKKFLDKFFGLPLPLVASFQADEPFGPGGGTYDRSAEWAQWAPAGTLSFTLGDSAGQQLRWGGHDAAGASLLPFSSLPLLGDRCWVIRSDNANAERAHQLMQALVVRLSCLLPHLVRFTLLDPLRSGGNFPMMSYLPLVREVGEDYAGALKDIQADIQRIITRVVAFHGDFESIPAEQRANERYEIIVAADCPQGAQYNYDVLNRLMAISHSGPAAGRYIILHHNIDVPMPHSVDFGALGDHYVIDLTKGANPHADSPPAGAQQMRILAQIQNARSRQPSAQFGDILRPAGQRWQGNVDTHIQTSLSGRDDGVAVMFGEPPGEASIVHGMLAASAGSGKSNLLHALIMGLATHYAPDDLQLYLLDLKQGVEFQPYARLPHAAVVAFNSDPALAQAVLAELKAEADRRYSMYFRPAGCQNLQQYRESGSPRGALPRILLIIDEYQALFQDNDGTAVSENLKDLSKQGRAAGVHMLLVSQNYRVSGMQDADSIINNINLRMAMNLPASTVMGMTEFEREGKDLIGKCDMPGKVVVNTNGGRNGFNHLGRAVLVSPQDRDALLDDLQALAAQWPVERRARFPRTQLFDGNTAPHMDQMSLSRAFASKGEALDAQDLAALATRPAAEGGFEMREWRVSDRAVPVSLGRAFAVHGEALCVLGRVQGQNLLVVSDVFSARVAMLGAVLASLLQLAPEVRGTIVVIDGSSAPEITRILDDVGDAIVALREEDEILSYLAASDGGEGVLVLFEPERVSGLLRSTDPLSRNPGPDALDARLREGPGKGRHTIALFSTFRMVENAFGRRGRVENFAWRACTQMSLEDSQNLLGNRNAAMLQASGGGPRPALLADINANRYTRFLPWDMSDVAED
mgnify:FL=1